MIVSRIMWKKNTKQVNRKYNLTEMKYVTN